MKSIGLQGISFSIENKSILDFIDLEISPGEFFLLLGPSGCGKTTLLRLMAGFYQPQTGEIYFDDRKMNNIPPQERNIGMVFQSYALFPHMTVAQNIEYGLKLRNMDKTVRNNRISRVLEMVRLSGYEKRFPGTLSGGEQQRVALARALAIEPDILLLDEPLSNLDAKLRIQMRQEIREIHQNTKVTTVYVTHDQDEALSMADRIAIMQQGKILQTGSPQEIYYQPVNSFVAGFIGEANLVTGKIKEKINESQLVMDTTLGDLIVNNPKEIYPPGSTATCCIRPESIRISENNNSSHTNQFIARISDFQFLGESMHLILNIHNSTILRTLLPHPRDQKIQRNQEIQIHIPPGDILLLKD